MAGGHYYRADSHTRTYGALGAFATGWAAPTWRPPWPWEAWFKVPSTIKFEYQGFPGWQQRPDFTPSAGSAWTGPLLRHGIRRRGHRPALHGRAHDHDQHGHQAGGKCGYMEPDQKTLDTLKGGLSGV